MKLAIASLSALLMLGGAACEKKKVEDTAQKVGEAARAVGETVAEGAKKAGETIARGAKTAWEATKEGAKYVGEKVAAGAQYVGEKVAAGAKVVAKEAKDAWITTKIKAKIGIMNLLSVHVKTDKGVVTLSGTVKTEDEKKRIEAYARGTDGVTQVVSQIEVKP